MEWFSCPVISFWFIYFSKLKTLPKNSQSQTSKHNLRFSVRPFAPLLIPGSAQTQNDLIQCFQFLARLKIKFKDWITPTQSVLFCPTSSISLSKMSSVSIWTRGLCFIISSAQHLKALGLPGIPWERCPLPALLELLPSLLTPLEALKWIWF